MIKIITKAYQVNGVAYATLEEAQSAELQELSKDEDFADFVMANKAKILDILTTKPNSRPTRRKIHKPEVVVATAKPVVPVVAPIETSKLTL